MLKILGILGGVGFACVLLLVCGIFAVSYLGTQNSGWTAETLHGHSINLPAGEGSQVQSIAKPEIVFHELIARRVETGSTYSLVIGKLPTPPGQELELVELVRIAKIQVVNPRPVTRSGVTGFAANELLGSSGVPGSESEVFVHNGYMVVTTYAPYSKARQVFGWEEEPQANERQLDRPEEFFASLRFP